MSCRRLIPRLRLDNLEWVLLLYCILSGSHWSSSEWVELYSSLRAFVNYCHSWLTYSSTSESFAYCWWAICRSGKDPVLMVLKLLLQLLVHVLGPRASNTVLQGIVIGDLRRLSSLLLCWDLLLWRDGCWLIIQARLTTHIWSISIQYLILLRNQWISISIYFLYWSSWSTSLLHLSRIRLLKLWI
jgi:hypothetical protein